MLKYLFSISLVFALLLKYAHLHPPESQRLSEKRRIRNQGRRSWSPSDMLHNLPDIPRQPGAVFIPSPGFKFDFTQSGLFAAEALNKHPAGLTTGIYTGGLPEPSLNNQLYLDIVLLTEKAATSTTGSENITPSRPSLANKKPAVQYEEHFVHNAPIQYQSFPSFEQGKHEAPSESSHYQFNTETDVKNYFESDPQASEAEFPKPSLEDSKSKSVPTELPSPTIPVFSDSSPILSLEKTSNDSTVKHMLLRIESFFKEIGDYFLKDEKTTLKASNINPPNSTVFNSTFVSNVPVQYVFDQVQTAPAGYFPPTYGIPNHPNPGSTLHVLSSTPSVDQGPIQGVGNLPLEPFKPQNYPKLPDQLSLDQDSKDTQNFPKGSASKEFEIFNRAQWKQSSPEVIKVLEKVNLNKELAVLGLFKVRPIFEPDVVDVDKIHVSVKPEISVSDRVLNETEATIKENRDKAEYIDFKRRLLHYTTQTPITSIHETHQQSEELVEVTTAIPVARRIAKIHDKTPILIKSKNGARLRKGEVIERGNEYRISNGQQRPYAPKSLTISNSRQIAHQSEENDNDYVETKKQGKNNFRASEIRQTEPSHSESEPTISKKKKRRTTTFKTTTTENYEESDESQEDVSKSVEYDGDDEEAIVEIPRRKSKQHYAYKHRH